MLSRRRPIPPAPLATPAALTSQNATAATAVPGITSATTSPATPGPAQTTASPTMPTTLPTSSGSPPASDSHSTAADSARGDVQGESSLGTMPLPAPILFCFTPAHHSWCQKVHCCSTLYPSHVLPLCTPSRSHLIDQFAILASMAGVRTDATDHSAIMSTPASGWASWTMPPASDPFDEDTYSDQENALRTTDESAWFKRHPYGTHRQDTKPWNEWCSRWLAQQKLCRQWNHTGNLPPHLLHELQDQPNTYVDRHPDTGLSSAEHSPNRIYWPQHYKVWTTHGWQLVLTATATAPIWDLCEHHHRVHEEAALVSHSEP